MLAFIKAVPQSGPLIGDLIAKNMDWPGAEEIGSRLASMLPPHLLDKKLEQLPPEAKALVSSLMQQMQQLKQEHDQAVQLLGDKNADRALEKEGLANERDKIAKDFEAKMTKVAADMQAKLIACIPQPGEPPEDHSAELALEHLKIMKDFEAKILKLMADQEAKHQEREHNLQMALLHHQSTMEQTVSSEKQEKGMRRQSDMDQYKKLNEKLTEKLTEMNERFKDLENAEFEHIRDPNTRRITKTRRVKRATH